MSACVLFGYTRTTRNSVTLRRSLGVGCFLQVKASTFKIINCHYIVEIYNFKNIEQSSFYAFLIFEEKFMENLVPNFQNLVIKEKIFMIFQLQNYLQIFSFSTDFIPLTLTFGENFKHKKKTKKKITHIIVKSIHSSLRSESKSKSAHFGGGCFPSFLRSSDRIVFGNLVKYLACRILTLSTISSASTRSRSINSNIKTNSALLKSERKFAMSCVSKTETTHVGTTSSQ
ncbi:hypothetical protein AGLY_004686 [Aphis glycines]|uniref:Uncharacterized protein n=1 Tax=Aphis glycines TaxID=307491 RepID=A0A6G0TV04_APHGL|nr:hypothetical protein AGLY_004686 [Aphis glycines]